MGKGRFLRVCGLSAERLLAQAMAAGYWTALTVVLVGPRWGRLSVWGRELPEGADRLEHFFAFALLAMLIHWAGWFRRPLALAAVLCAYAVMTELAQMLVPSRIFDPLDLIANVAGMAAGLGVFQVPWSKIVRGKNLTRRD